MSWIKVRRDNIELLVSTESYRDLFSKQGYEVVAEQPSPTQPQPKKTEEPKVAEVKVKEINPKEVNLNELPQQTNGANKGKHKARERVAQ